ncbi:hypothetical protein HDU76_012075 [Blyttiomyces sp. JEL0837]|nr:hypothetical protein HDU76_012075 [Blyttiomyces sp. JEL0837]
MPASSPITTARAPPPLMGASSSVKAGSKFAGWDILLSLPAQNLIVSLSDAATNVIECSPPTAADIPVPPITEFITTVVEMSKIKMDVLLGSLIYLDRLRRKLPSTARAQRLMC